MLPHGNAQAILLGGFRHLLHTPYISLVNLICGHEVVKELFAINFTEDNIRKELHQILHVQSYRQNMLNNYKNMKQVLGGPGASDRAAEIILAAINKYSSKLSILISSRYREALEFFLNKYLATDIRKEF